MSGSPPDEALGEGHDLTDRVGAGQHGRKPVETQRHAAVRRGPYWKASSMTMTLLGELNWWAPGPLRRLHNRFGLHEASAEEHNTVVRAGSPAQ